MKKITVLLLAVVMAFGLVFAGCNNSNTNYSNNLSGLDGEVSSNGGFAVVKGEYVYFINGIAANTDDNTFGKPVTGALVRIKKSDLAAAADGNTETTVKTEMVIPSLFVAGDMTSGFYIFGSNVYFASPYTEKNKAGEVENSKLSFARASLDGKEKTVIATVDDNTTVYRYVEKDGTVYLMIKTTVKDERSDDETATRAAIVVYNADNGEKVFTSEKVGEYDFGEGTDIYYTVTPYDEELEQEEKYNDIYRYDLGAEKAELVASGKGSLGTTDGKGEGLTGATYSVIKNGSDALYVKVTYVDTSVATVTEYRAYMKKDDKVENGGTVEVLNRGSANASKVFANTSYFVSKNCILYLDSTYGLSAYNYQFEGTQYNGDPIVDKTASLFCDKDLNGYTVKFWNDGYVYLTDSNNYYYRVKVLGELINADGTEPAKMGEGKIEKVCVLASSTSWYLPEVIGDYFFSVYTASPYNSLVYVTDIKTTSDLKDEDIEKIRKSEKEVIEANLSTCVSKISETIQKTIDDYIKDTFKTEDK